MPELTRVSQDLIQGVEAQGSTFPRSLASRFSDIINVKDYGALGDGIADDSAAVQSAFNAAPNYACVYFPKGTYRLNSIEITKSVQINGDGQNSTFLHLRNAQDRNIFHISARFNDVFLNDFTIRDPHGFRIINLPYNPPSEFSLTTSAIETTPLWIFNSNTQYVCTNYTVTNVTFIDWWVDTDVFSKNSNFFNNTHLSTYGQWSMGGKWDWDEPGNPGSGPQYPKVGILGSAWNINIQGCYWNGLVDPTFANVNAAAYAYPQFKCGKHGFPHNVISRIIPQTFNISSEERGYYNFENNVVLNHHIEGLQMLFSNFETSGPPTWNWVENQYELNISNNLISNQLKEYGDPPNVLPEFAGTNPAINIGGSIRPNITIQNNTIGPALTGIVINPIAVQVVGQTSTKVGFPQTGKLRICNNVINEVAQGINVSFVFPTDIIENNTINCNGNYYKNQYFNFLLNPTFQSASSRSYQDIIGIYINNGNPIIRNNTITGKYAWDATKTIIAQNGDWLTLSDVSGITLLGTPPRAACVVPYDGWAQWLPIFEINGNQIRVDDGSGWLAGRVFPSGTTLYFSLNSQGGIRTSGIWTLFTMPTTGESWTSQQAGFPANQIYDNTIKGFLRDHSYINTNYPTPMNVAEFTNTTSQDVFEIAFKNKNPQRLFYKTTTSGYYTIK